MMLTGSTDGAIYVWNPKNGERAQKIDVDTSSIQTLACFPGVADAAADLILVGGKENNLQAITYSNGKFKALWTIDVGGKPRSIDLCLKSGKFLLGLKNGSIVEMPMSDDGNKLQTTIMSSHCDGEVWGLQVVDLGGGNTRILTSADDNRIICYDGKTHRKLAEGHVGQKKAKLAKKKRRAGASSMSSLPEECQSRCVAFSKKKNHLAVAANDGKVTVREIDWAHVEKNSPGCLDDVLVTLFGKLKRAEWIETMAYSPDEKTLAVGSHDNNIYLVETGAYKQVKKLTGHSSFLKALDWTLDSKYLRSVCGAHELLFFNAGAKKRDPAGASNTVAMHWADQTCPFGWSVQGIFPSGCDGTHINSVCLSPNEELIATGDDFGLVSLFRNPALKKHKANRYRGHSEHVTHVRFSESGHLMFSAGGQD